MVEVAPRLLAKRGESAAVILSTMRALGFHPNTLTNDYDPATYPQAMRRPQPPVRCIEVSRQLSDLAFSRIDAYGRVNPRRRP